MISADVKLPLFYWVQNTIVSLSSTIGSFSAALLAGIPLSANEVKSQHVLTSSVVCGGLSQSFQALLSASTEQFDSNFRYDGFSMFLKCISTENLQLHWPSPRVCFSMKLQLVKPYAFICKHFLVHVIVSMNCCRSKSITFYTDTSACHHISKIS